MKMLIASALVIIVLELFLIEKQSYLSEYYTGNIFIVIFPNKTIYNDFANRIRAHTNIDALWLTIG